MKIIDKALGITENLRVTSMHARAIAPADRRRHNTPGQASTPNVLTDTPKPLTDAHGKIVVINISDDRTIIAILIGSLIPSISSLTFPI